MGKNAHLVKSHLIGVGGGSASGKTTVAKKIAALLGKDAEILEMDSYYRDLSHLTKEQRETVNFDHPQAMDLALFQKHLVELKSGRGIDKPVYNFHAHKLETKTDGFEPRAFIIAEGLFILSDELKNAFIYRIFIDTPEDIRLARRLTRDIKERGRTKEAVLAQYAATVKHMHDAFVEPTAKNADMILSWEKEDVAALEKIVRKIKQL